MKSIYHSARAPPESLHNEQLHRKLKTWKGDTRIMGSIYETHIFVMIVIQCNCSTNLQNPSIQNAGYVNYGIFAATIEVLQSLVIALGAGLGVWGVINLLEGYGNDNPGANAPGR